MNKLIKKPASVVGYELVTLKDMVKDKMLPKLLAIVDKKISPLHKILNKLKSSFSNSNSTTSARSDLWLLN